MKKGAIIKNKIYRYSLWRIWDETKPLILYIGLNPSRATQVKSDPTINRLIQFTKDHGYGGFYMGNLFAFRSHLPKDLIYPDDPIGPENNEYLLWMKDKCKDICFMWGSNKFISYKGRNNEIIKLFNNSLCFGKTKDGHPRHPLYLSTEKILIPFKL